MEIFKFVGVLLLGTIVFIVLINISAYLSVRLSKWIARKKESKWDMNLFSIPNEIPELEPYPVTRSIYREDEEFVFSFECNNRTSKRNYYYRNPKEALSNYVADFQKEELAFYNRNKNSLKKVLTLSEKLDSLELQADRIESELNQLKESLGEKND